ncbi:hypothetical protein B0H16DRAFT_1414128 [Mycena metata]|uniref:Uncharacterized protein n=1 Tax=Mycena metata TaxID=1033252 RepID=A0AAD7NIE8_9AGAR|nr:hypothetical protein B0H16DRAFT_1414128 [Mycena metata]
MGPQTIAMARLVLRLLFSLLLVPLSLGSLASRNNASDIHVAARAQAQLDFSSSQWIWTGTPYTLGAPVGLRKVFQSPTSPSRKALVGGEVIITAFDTLDFYVNGALIGGDDIRPRYASRFCVSLLPFSNVFAVQAAFTGVTSADQGAVIATILLTYSDGTTQLLSTDTTWVAKQNPDVGFEQPTFNDLPWSAAAKMGVINDAPWDEVNIPNATFPSITTFDRNRWIWTDAIPASGNIPAGSRAFRRRFVPQPGQIPMSASIIITADNSYQLWVNNVAVGSGNGFKTADSWTINFSSMPSVIVFAVLVTNKAGTAGLMMGSEINFRPAAPTGCIAGSFVNTEASVITTWVSTTQNIPAGWQQVAFDDSSWAPVVTEGEFPNAQPWGSDVTVAPPITTVNI